VILTEKDIARIGEGIPLRAALGMRYSEEAMRAVNR
jgi:hypothetical protein